MADVKEANFVPRLIMATLNCIKGNISKINLIVLHNDIKIPTNVADMIFEHVHSAIRNEIDLNMFMRNYCSLSRFFMNPFVTNYDWFLLGLDKQYLRNLRFIGNISGRHQKKRALEKFFNNLNTVNTIHCDFDYRFRWLYKYLLTSFTVIKEISLCLLTNEAKDFDLLNKYLRNCTRLETLILRVKWINRNDDILIEEIEKRIFEKNFTLMNISFYDLDLGTSLNEYIDEFLTFDRITTISFVNCRLKHPEDLDEWEQYVGILSPDVPSTRNFSSLIKFTLEDCRLDETDSVAIAYLFNQCTHLQFVNLSKNPLIGNGLKKIFNSLTASRKTLIDLNFSYCRIKETHCVWLQSLIQVSENIMKICLNGNKIGNGIKIICDTFRYANKLAEVNLEMCCLTKEQVIFTKKFIEEYKCSLKLYL